MSELDNDYCCLTCNNSSPISEDENGNPEYVFCRVKGRDQANDAICSEYE